MNIQRIWLEKLEIKDYRNINNADITFSKDINIISGENGQGKTNLLEAIWLLCGGKSFRGSKDKELIRLNYKNAFVRGYIRNEEQIQTKIEINVVNTLERKGRFAKINGGESSRAITIAGRINCVVFAPSHLNILTGAPALRRKFIDASLCQLYPSFISDYRKFEDAMVSKNAVIREVYKYRYNDEKTLYEVFNRMIATVGYQIYLKRKEYIGKLSKRATFYYNEISQGKEKITIEYKNFAHTQDEMLYKLNNNLEADLKMGYACCGIQREDIEIKINGLLAKDFASQGQQRSIVLALKLAESDIFSEVCERDPIILLDDVLSELDYSRQEYLLNKIEGKQVFITSCDENRIKLSKSKKYYVRNGMVEECT